MELTWMSIVNLLIGGFIHPYATCYGLFVSIVMSVLFIVMLVKLCQIIVYFCRFLRWLFYQVSRGNWEKCPNSSCEFGMVEKKLWVCEQCGGGGEIYGVKHPDCFDEPGPCGYCGGKGGYCIIISCPICQGRGIIPPK
jgi:hypothetical protein